MTEPGARRVHAVTRFADVRRRRQVGSTNEVAADLARGGAPEGVVVVADHQTAGRGRWGRSWTAKPGSSLLVSVVLRPGADRGPLTLIPLAGGLAAADACLDVAGFAPGLKWPNDLVVGDAKLGGILAELVAGPSDGRRPAVVLGVGLNLTWPVDDQGAVPLEGGVAAADEVAGRPVGRDELLEAFLARLAERYGVLSDPVGRDALFDDYRRRCVTVGREVRAELPGGTVVEGQATDVAPDGALVVREPAGTNRVVAASEVVHVGRPPTGAVNAPSTSPRRRSGPGRS